MRLGAWLLHQDVDLHSAAIFSSVLGKVSVTSMHAHLEARLREVFSSFCFTSHSGFAALLLHELRLLKRQPVFCSEFHLFMCCAARG